MNSRNNPFASRHIESFAYQCIDMPWEDITARLKTLNYRAAIIGPEGSGKTTLMETIGAGLREKGFQTFYMRFDAKNKKIKRDIFNHIPETISMAHAFLADGAEQLSWLAWKRLCRCTKKAGAVLVTAHAKAALPTLVNTHTSPALLYGLVLQLVGKNEMLSCREIDRLFELHNGNIRLALRDLYDIWADKW